MSFSLTTPFPLGPWFAPLEADLSGLVYTWAVVDMVSAVVLAVVNHGMPKELKSKMVEEQNEFFDLPGEEKMKYTRKNVLDPIQYGSNFIQYGSNFNVAVEEVRYWRDFLKVILHLEFNSPDKPPGFRQLSRSSINPTLLISLQVSGN